MAAGLPLCLRELRKGKRRGWVLARRHPRGERGYDGFWGGGCGVGVRALALAARAEGLGAEGVVAGLEEGVEAALAAGGVEVRYVGAVG